MFQYIYGSVFSFMKNLCELIFYSKLANNILKSLYITTLYSDIIYVIYTYNILQFYIIKPNQNIYIK